MRRLEDSQAVQSTSTAQVKNEDGSVGDTSRVPFGTSIPQSQWWLVTYRLAIVEIMEQSAATTGPIKRRPGYSEYAG